MCQKQVLFSYTCGKSKKKSHHLFATPTRFLCANFVLLRFIQDMLGFFSFFLRTPTHSCCWNWDPVAVVVWCARQTSPDFWPHYCIGAPNESSLPRAQIIPLGVMVVEGSRADMPNIMTNNTLPMG